MATNLSNELDVATTPLTATTYKEENNFKIPLDKEYPLILIKEEVPSVTMS